MPSKKNKNKKKQSQQHQQQQQPQQHHKTAAISVEKSKLYRIENSDIYGRFLAADRALKPGELLITELPLAIGPCVSAEPVCLGCYMPVQLTAAQYRCGNCQWPLCSSKCRGVNKPHGHDDTECALLKRTNTAAKLTTAALPVDIKNLYEIILIARILQMKYSNRKNYEKILEMESHLELRKANATLWQHYQRNAVERLRNEWQLAEQYDEIEIQTVCGILDVNCFEIGQNNAKARTLYPSAFYLAHDCSPNTSHTDDPETYAIILRTSRQVGKDEALTLSYAYTLQGTLKRRDFMHAGKLFWCSCKRCADPLELGTDCSALVCAKCTKGSVRSIKPLEQNADWNCDSCDYKLNATEVVNLLDKINNDLEIIDVHDIAGLENFLTRYRDVLRPNHYLLLSAKYSLCQLYGRTDGYLLHTMSVEDLRRKERYCREFLKVIDVLEPGLTRLRGLIMYELHAPLMILAQRLIQNNLINKSQFQNSIKEVLKLLRESREILMLEPAGSNEHHMGLAAEAALQQMGGN